MDSMRSLNTSLPTTSNPPSRIRQVQSPPVQPLEELLQKFKSAALSVTTLYRTAASNQARSHASGYSDAVDDLLGFLDRENLGLKDGEGSIVRQWVTERARSGAPAPGNSDSDEDASEEHRRARSSSPAPQNKYRAEVTEQRPTVSEISRPDLIPHTPSTEPTCPTKQSIPNSLTADDHISREEFSFRSPITYSTTHHDTDAEGPSMRLEVVPRHHRPSNRHFNRPNGRNTQSNLTFNAFGSLGPGAGLKRKSNFCEWFDLGNGKDGLGGSIGGGKRGRHC